MVLRVCDGVGIGGDDDVLRKSEGHVFMEGGCTPSAAAAAVVMTKAARFGASPSVSKERAGKRHAKGWTSQSQNKPVRGARDTAMARSSAQAAREALGVCTAYSLRSLHQHTIAAFIPGSRVFAPFHRGHDPFPRLAGFQLASNVKRVVAQWHYAVSTSCGLAVAGACRELWPSSPAARPNRHLHRIEITARNISLHPRATPICSVPFYPLRARVFAPYLAYLQLTSEHFASIA